MFRAISRQAWPAFVAVVVATMTALPAAGQEFAERCTIEPGRVPAEQLTSCFEELDGKVNSLESENIAASEVNNKLDIVLTQIELLKAEMASLQSTVGELTELQLVTTEKVEEEDIEFDFDTPALTDGLVVAFIADRSGNGTSGWGRIQGFVDERVSDSRVNPDVLRAADSYSTTNHPYERSATIVMPVRTGEYYKIVQTSEVPFNPDLHMRNIYFVTLGIPASNP